MDDFTVLSTHFDRKRKMLHKIGSFQVQCVLFYNLIEFTTFLKFTIIRETVFKKKYYVSDFKWIERYISFNF